MAKQKGYFPGWKPIYKNWEPVAEFNPDEEKFMRYRKFDRRWLLYTTPEELIDPVAMFVYGTLRSGDPDAINEIHGILHDIGVAIADKVDDPEAGVIIGEVLYCERWYMEDTLDKYEGYPHSYNRKLVQTLDPEGIEVWVYVVGSVRRQRLNDRNLMESPACWRREDYWRGVILYECPETD